MFIRCCPKRSSDSMLGSACMRLDQSDGVRTPASAPVAAKACALAAPSTSKAAGELHISKTTSRWGLVLDFPFAEPLCRTSGGLEATRHCGRSLDDLCS
eukprot:4864073-Amphidinium_carterae.1